MRSLTTLAVATVTAVTSMLTVFSPIAHARYGISDPSTKRYEFDCPPLAGGGGPEGYQAVWRIKPGPYETRYSDLITHRAIQRPSKVDSWEQAYDLANIARREGNTQMMFTQMMQAVVIVEGKYGNSAVVGLIRDMQNMFKIDSNSSQSQMFFEHTSYC